LFQKKGGNVKTIPPYKPVPIDVAVSDSSPEKEGPLSKQQSVLSGTLPKKKGGKVSNSSPAPSASVKSSVIANNVSQPHELSSSSQSDTQASVSSAPLTVTPSSNKFTSSNFTETLLTTSESVLPSAGCKKRKLGARTPTPNPSPCPDQEAVPDQAASLSSEGDWKSCKKESAQDVYVSHTPSLTAAPTNMDTTSSNVATTASMPTSLPAPAVSPSPSHSPSGLVFSTTSSHPQHLHSLSITGNPASQINFAAAEEASSAHMVHNSGLEHGKRR
jgi:hypothetical protein